MIQINSIPLGLPTKEGVQIMIRPIINSTTDKSCNTYYEVQSEKGEVLASGNVPISEADYTAWAEDNAFIEDVVLKTLGLTRKQI